MIHCDGQVIRMDQIKNNNKMFNVQSWKKIKSLYATFKQRTGAYNGKINLKSSVEWAYLIGGKENQYIIKYNLP